MHKFTIALNFMSNISSINHTAIVGSYDFTFWVTRTVSRHGFATNEIIITIVAIVFRLKKKKPEDNTQKKGAGQTSQCNGIGKTSNSHSNFSQAMIYILNLLIKIFQCF